MSRSLRQISADVVEEEEAYSSDENENDEEHYEDDYDDHEGLQNAENVLRQSSKSTRHGREMSVGEAADAMVRGKPKNLFALLYKSAGRTRVKREIYNPKRMNEMAEPNAASTGKVYFKKPKGEGVAKEGDRVEAKLPRSSKYYAGQVTRVSKRDGARIYTIKFDNGDIHDVEKRRVRILRERKFASDEDCKHCTFMPRRIKKVMPGDEKKDNEESKLHGTIGFLARMEAKETKRRVTLAEKRAEKAKKELAAAKKGPKGSAKQLQNFLTRLEKSEKDKEERRLKLEKKHTPAFRALERVYFDKEDGKVKRKPMHSEPRDWEGFMARMKLAEDKKRQLREEEEARKVAPPRFQSGGI